METIHRTSAFKTLFFLILWGCERDFVCVQNGIKAALSNNQDSIACKEVKDMKCDSSLQPTYQFEERQREWVNGKKWWD